MKKEDIIMDLTSALGELSEKLKGLKGTFFLK